MYRTVVFPNGRIAIFPWKDFDEAVKQEKEILIFCGGWSGGYAAAFGADCYDEEYLSLYNYDINNEVLTPEDYSKFYRIIITDGIKVYMLTGEPANSWFNGIFEDSYTKYNTYSATVSEAEFQKMRREIDIQRTLNAITGENKTEIQNAIKHYLY